jgi:hypothetical protein
MPRAKRLEAADAIARTAAREILSTPGASAHDHQLLVELVVRRLVENRDRIGHLADDVRGGPSAP